MAGSEHPAVYARRRTLALATAGVLLVALAAFLVVQATADDDPPAVTGAPRDAVAAVQSFGRALAARDFGSICDEHFTLEAHEAAGGDQCSSVLAQGLAEVRSPRIAIRAVAVRGAAATVTVLASQRGKPPVVDTLQLVRERGRFRIASAGAVGGD